MSRPRVLVLGGTGMLGHKLVQVLGAESGIDLHCALRGRLPDFMPAIQAQYHPLPDIVQRAAAVAALLARVQPDYVVNAVGAIKQKDLAADPDATFYLNGTLPHLLGLLNPNPAGRVIQISTDCVFRGDAGHYREADAPDVADLYGRSKAVGELDYAPHLTLRTSIIGFELHNHLGLLGWFFSQPRGATVHGYTHAIYSGLPTITLCRLIHDLIVARTQLTGIYHVASAPIAKYDLLRRLNTAFDLGITIVPDDSVRIDRSLEDQRFRDATATQRPGWDELVAQLRVDYDSLPYARLYEPRRGVLAAT